MTPRETGDRMLREAAQAHLSDDELMGRAAQTLEPMTLARAEAHLGRCRFCQSRLDLLAEPLEVLEEDRRPVTAREQALIRRLLGAGRPEPEPAPVRERLRGWLAGLRPLVPALKTTTTESVVQRGESADGLHTWTVSEQKDGGLLICLSTFALELEGAAVRVGAGEHSWTGILERLDPEQVGFELTIPAEERRRLPQPASFTFEAADPGAGEERREE